MLIARALIILAFALVAERGAAGATAPSAAQPPAIPSSPSPPPPWALHLVLEGPEGCRDPQPFYGGLARRLPGAHEAGERAEEEIHVRLQKGGDKVEGELWFGQGPQALPPTPQRRVEGASCGEVLQVLSLTAALALEGRPRRASAVDPKLSEVKARAGSGADLGAKSPTATAPASPVVREEPKPSRVASPNAAPLPVEGRAAQEPVSPTGASPERSEPQVALASPDQVSATAAPRDSSAEEVLGRREVAGPRPPLDVSRDDWQAGAGLWFGQVIEPLTGIELGLARRLGRTPLVVGASLLGASDVGWLGARTLDVQLGGVNASFCVAWRVGRLSLSPCGFAFGCWLRVRDGLIDHPRRVTRTWGAAGFEGAASWLISGAWRATATLRVGPTAVKRTYATEVPEVVVGSTPDLFFTMGAGFAWMF